MKSLLSSQLQALGIQAGDIVLAHSSFKSLGIRDPEEILGALLDTLGPKGTLLMPALTYQQQPRHIHDARYTPSCVGFLTEYFRQRPGTRRSLHPTHSVCAVGSQAQAMLENHGQDTTPCGKNSPFNQLIERGGKILMIGCGLRPNTTMHAIEEYVCPPYLFGAEREYTITDQDGRTFQKTYRTHGFGDYRQRYDRAAGLLNETELRTGQVGNATCHLIAARALHRVAVAKMQEDPFYFVELDADRLEEARAPLSQNQ
ncbi:MAG TPA: AAC(3) family N-acetyltransferase [Chthonomonadaceae bacterium]|nr:AAC(3) family N-acetyltransferase [Chthonomonadaceae bacterium]